MKQFLLGIGWLVGGLWPLIGAAQAPAWQQALAINGMSAVQGTAVNAAGDVFVTGYFLGRVTFGNTTLTGAGSRDVFVAKWSTSSNAWAWAVSGGGTNSDTGNDIVVSGTSVYATGSVYNNANNANNVRFNGQVVNGMAGIAGTDIFVAKYTDNGSSATYNWTVVGGGNGGDQGAGLALSGTALYLTGTVLNNSSNAQAVTLAGTVLSGASSASTYDIFLAKLTDTGTDLVCNWAVAAGGSSDDGSTAVAVSGSSVYITGLVPNNTANVRNVAFGGVPLPGLAAASGFDVFVAKYTDMGTQGAYRWAVAAGGAGYDQGTSIAASGTEVYVAGAFYNNTANTNAVLVGGMPLAGASPTLGQDMLLAKYSDTGSSATLNWAVAGGGSGPDYASDVLVANTDVYVTGTFSSNALNTMGTHLGSLPLAGYTPAANSNGSDIFVARYPASGGSDTPTWAVVGGGPGIDYGTTLALGGGQLWLGGIVTPAATFSPLAVASPVSTNAGLLAGLPSTILATRAARPDIHTSFTPNPATTRTTLTMTGLPAGVRSVEATLHNPLGQVVRHLVVPCVAGVAQGEVSTAGLAGGVYLLRLSDTVLGPLATQRLQVQ